MLNFTQLATLAKPPPRLGLDDALQAVRTTAASIKPLQVLSGFVLAVFLGSSAVVATGQAVSNFLAEDGNGEVLERTLKVCACTPRALSFTCVPRTDRPPSACARGAASARAVRHHLGECQGRVR